MLLKQNVNCFLFAAFLSEVKKNSIDDLQQLRQLISKGGTIISKTIPRLEAQSMFHKFCEYCLL